MVLRWALTWLALMLVVACHAAGPDRSPNVVVILVDDLGYGDLGCYGSTRYRTPHIDRLARDGMRFINAYAPASVCTPARYGLLTGRYCWRLDQPENRRSQVEQWRRVPYMPSDGRYVGHVAIESNEQLMIRDGQVTIASLLKAHGYTTACVGKWHLGFGRVGMSGWTDEFGPDWNGELKPGPLEVGFDYFHGLPIVAGSEPKVIVENHHVIGLDRSDPIRLVLNYQNGRLQYKMEGGALARFKPERLDQVNSERAVAWIEQAVARRRPFFLYYATSAVHGPYAPAPRFRGTSGEGVFGDVMAEMDWCVGEILAALDRLGIANNTLVVFASDNGGGPGHNGSLRGSKTEVYEGGSRVPLIVRWPGRIAPGVESGNLAALTDMMATVAAIIEEPLPHDAGEDSFSLLPTLLGQEPGGSARRSLVTDSMLGMFAIQEDGWKLIVGQDGGSYRSLSVQTDAPAGQLFNLREDPGETKNVYAEHGAIVDRLTNLLARIRSEGRSRP